MMKWIIGLVVIVAAGAALWWSGILTKPATTPQTTQNTTATTTAEQAPGSGLSTAQGDTTDSAIVQDTATIDAQMKAYQSDSAAVDQSANDKPVTQSY